MRGAFATVVCVAVAWAAWHYAGEAAEHLGLDDLDPLPRLAGAFIVLSGMERVLARLLPPRH